MIAVLNRVKSAAVEADGDMVGRCGEGLLITLGVADTDTEEDVRTLVDKILKLRIFRDGEGMEGKLNLSVRDINGEILVISNFTLLANCRRGTRPDYSHAAPREISEPLYLFFIDEINKHGIHAEHGRFGARMSVHIEADGPVMITLDSNKLPRK